tara:strand:- start:620 stop:1477 length:858 start_codon:yes stop_codon:yes gene_type:complete
MKIVVGTANFNQKYGISKIKIKNSKEISNILNFLKKNKIRYIDTAHSYKFSRKFVSKFDFKNFRIITKIQLPKKGQNLFLKNLEKKIKDDLHNFNIKQFETILLHNIYDINQKYGVQFLQKFFELKKKKFTKNIGISIYDPKDFDFIIKRFRPDVVQFPLNIFDQRFLDGKFLQKLKKKNIKSQVRSIFLQGIISNIKKSETFLKKTKLKHHIKILETWCKKNNISLNEACIFFIKKQKNINFVTIGIDNLNQLKQNLAILKKNKSLNLFNFAIKNKDIIDPRKW